MQYSSRFSWIWFKIKNLKQTTYIGLQSLCTAHGDFMGPFHYCNMGCALLQTANASWKNNITDGAIYGPFLLLPLVAHSCIAWCSVNKKLLQNKKHCRWRILVQLLTRIFNTSCSIFVNHYCLFICLFQWKHTWVVLGEYGKCFMTLPLPHVHCLSHYSFIDSVY